MQRLKTEVKAINPQLILSIAPAIYPFCLNHLMQDSPTWIKEELVDFLHPQIYREIFANYEKEVKNIAQKFNAQQRAKFAPGIAFRANKKDLTVADIIKSVKLNRDTGFQGQIFFHYEGLKANNNAIAIALQNQAGYDLVATVPQPSTIA